MYFSVNPSILSARLTSLNEFTDAASPYVMLVSDQTTQTITISAKSVKGHSEIVISADVTNNGTITLNQDLLSKIVRTYFGASLFIKTSICGTKICISQNAAFPAKSTISMPSVSAVILAPQSTQKTANFYAEIDPGDLSLIAGCIRALKGDIGMAKNVADSLNITREDTKIYFTTISGRGMVSAGIECKSKVNVTGSLSVNVPIDILSKLPTTSSSIRFSDKGALVMFMADEWTVHSSTITAHFPSPSSLKALPHTAYISFMAKDMLPVLRRASIIMDSVNTGPKQVMFNVVNNQLEVGINSTKGDYSDTIVCCHDSIANPVSFFMPDLVSSIVAIGADSVKLEWIYGGVRVTKAAINNNEIDISCIIKPIAQTVTVPITQTGGDTDGEEETGRDSRDGDGHSEQSSSPDGDPDGGEYTETEEGDTTTGEDDGGDPRE